MSGNSKPDLVTTLIDALSAPSLEVRSVAVQGLARQGDARALKPIMESIRGLAGEGDISQYVSDVMKALTYFDNISALESFASLLDAEFDDLHLIVWHLTAEADRSTVEEIAEFYEDDVEPLERILNGPYSIDIRKLIIHILWEIDTWSANLVLTDILQNIDEDEYLTSEAVHALGWNRFSEAVEPLCAMLVDKDHYTDDARSYAADALGRIGDPRAVAPLVALLTDPDEDDNILTSSALKALKWLVLTDEEPEYDADEEMTDSTPPDGDDETFAVLLEALEAPGYRMKELAVRGLAALGDPRAVSPILEAISDPEESEEYRALCQSAIGAIGRIGDASAVAPLFRTLDTVADECEIFEDYRLGEGRALDEALQEVAGIGPGIIEPLREVVIGYYSLEIKATAIRTLGHISGPYPVPVLLEALKDISFGGDVAACAADELGIRKVEEAVEDLCKIILDPKHYGEHSRLFAIYALGDIGDPRALGPLREVISDSDTLGGTYGALSGEAYEAFESIVAAMESRSENGG
jgi:HEAT repeat protein